MVCNYSTLKIFSLTKKTVLLKLQYLKVKVSFLRIVTETGFYIDNYVRV